MLNWMKWNQPALRAILRVNPTPSVVPQAWKIRNGQSGCLRGLIVFLPFCAASQRSLSNGICDICGFNWCDLKSYINGPGRRPGCKVFSPNPSPDRCPAQDFVCEKESLASHVTKKMDMGSVCGLPSVPWGLSLNGETLVTSCPYPSLSVYLSISSESFKESQFNLINLYNLKWIINIQWICTRHCDRRRW